MKRKYQKEVNASNTKKNMIINAESQFLRDWAKLKKRVILEITDSVGGVNSSVDGRAESEEEMLIKEQEENSDEKILEHLAERKFTLYT